MPLAQFGVPLARFGVPLARFGVPLGIFGVPLGIFGVPLGIFGVPPYPATIYSSSGLVLIYSLQELDWFRMILRHLNKGV